MNEWLPSGVSASLTKSEEIRGVKVEVSMSPYDVPTGVRGYTDAKFFVIEFKYMTSDERVRSVPHGDHVFVEVGVNSRRIYRIRIDTEKLKFDTVAVEVKEAIEKTINELGPRANNRLVESYRLNENIILNNRRELFGEPEWTGQSCAVHYSPALVTKHKA